MNKLTNNVHAEALGKFFKIDAFDNTLKHFIIMFCLLDM